MTSIFLAFLLSGGNGGGDPAPAELPCHDWPRQFLPQKGNDYEWHVADVPMYFRDIVSLSDLNEPVLVINEGDSHDVEEVMAVFKDLPIHSVFAYTVTTPGDVLIASRLQKYTQAPHMRHFADYVEYNVFSQFCSKCGCIVVKEEQEAMAKSEFGKNGEFWDIASQTKTDKVKRHKYHHLYSHYLPKWTHQNTGAFLEIGLGCNMGYGPGESGKIWTKLFKNVHFVEYDQKCVQKFADVIKESNYGVFVGDQANITFLEEIKYTVSTTFDIVIDDGGHYNNQIVVSFLSLWPSVSIGGAYFIEDFGESSYQRDYLDCEKPTSMEEENPCLSEFFLRSLLDNLFWESSGKNAGPYGIEYIHCTKDICVIGK